MTVLLIAARVIVSVLIAAFVGLAFLPHFAAERLTSAQMFLTEKIERRRAGGRQ